MAAETWLDRDGKATHVPYTLVLLAPSSHRRPTLRPPGGSHREDRYAIDLSCVGYGAVPHLYLRLTLPIHDIIGTNCGLSPRSLTFLPLLPIL